jgi:nucleotide-binding universal stress UspA family protein
VTAGIVVAVDESAGAAAALRWAVREGRLRSAPVTAVMAWDHVQQHHVPPRPFDPDYDEDDARASLEAIVTAAVGDADVIRRAVDDLVVPALLRATEGADLLVVGDRGLGGFEELLVGSVGSQCIRHAPCPVAVVHAQGRHGPGPERVLVGYDGSAASRDAVAWAVEEARLRKAHLTVLHADPPKALWGFIDADALLRRSSEAEDAARSAIDAALRGLHTAGVAIDRVVVADAPARAILAASSTADLIVLGARGLGAFKGMLLGSVSGQVTHHAMCPVVVIRAPEEEAA